MANDDEDEDEDDEDAVEGRLGSVASDADTDAPKAPMSDDELARIECAVVVALATVADVAVVVGVILVVESDTR